MKTFPSVVLSNVEDQNQGLTYCFVMKFMNSLNSSIA